jgi:hypothetical protein
MTPSAWELYKQKQNISEIKTYLYSHDGIDYASDKWDYGLLKEIFDKHDITQIKVTSIPIDEKAFIVVPGPQNIGYEDLLNKQIQNLSRVVLFITGDEEGLFDIQKIIHPNIEIWIQYPHEKHKNYNKLPIGVPQHLKKMVPKYLPKQYDLYFGGQITHSRRKELADAIKNMPNSLFKPTAGFAQGDEPKEYYKNLTSAKIAPTPSGAVVIDSFRFFEAIEMLCLPIADKIDPKGINTNFYNILFQYNVPPVESVSSWFDLDKLVPELLNLYPQNMHDVVTWWIKYKRDLGIKLMRQVNA